MKPMNRRAFFATLLAPYLAPYLARFRPVPKSDLLPIINAGINQAWDGTVRALADNLFQSSPLMCRLSQKGAGGFAASGQKIGSMVQISKPGVWNGYD